ncbi:hypothetical protein EVAR_69589_1 [Eumeta japonica]|uniref:Uncharacterized protein n=1 Tax=Eumeta variegata TaxID=151549 RepID=A0A4C2A1A8_EUMVA|nr:hypothetical protein EVAR_69589_1 [Eumeta japonica]
MYFKNLTLRTLVSAFRSQHYRNRPTAPVAAPTGTATAEKAAAPLYRPSAPFAGTLQYREGKKNPVPHTRARMRGIRFIHPLSSISRSKIESVGLPPRGLHKGGARLSIDRRYVGSDESNNGMRSQKNKFRKHTNKLDSIQSQSSLLYTTTQAQHSLPVPRVEQDVPLQLYERLRRRSARRAGRGAGGVGGEGEGSRRLQSGRPRAKAAACPLIGGRTEIKARRRHRPTLYVYISQAQIYEKRVILAADALLELSSALRVGCIKGRIIKPHSIRARGAATSANNLTADLTFTRRMPKHANDDLQSGTSATPNGTSNSLTSEKFDFSLCTYQRSDCFRCYDSDVGKCQRRHRSRPAVRRSAFARMSRAASRPQ